MMIQQVHNTITQYHMTDDAEIVLCGLSGGADSVCLLLVLQTLNIPVAACHYHHGLRGVQADADEQFCRDLCAAHGIRFFSEHGDVRAAARQRKLSLETAAREERYAFFMRCVHTLHTEGYAAVAVATAHNADDNLETMLFHLIRGTGSAGLAGIPPVNPPYIRPLIAVERSDIEAYLRQRGEDWCTDSTNLEDDCTRNKLRHHVLPALRAIEPTAARHAVQTAEILRQENDFLSAQAAVSGQTIARTILLHDHPAISSRKIRCLMENSGIPSGMIGQTHIRAVQTLVQRGKGRISLPHQIQAVCTKQLLSLSPQSQKLPCIPLTPDVPVDFGAYTVVITRKISDIYSSFKQYPFSYDTINTSKLCVRSWQSSDRMRLSGMRGERSLKRLYTDFKIRPELRDGLPVLCCGEQLIAAAALGTDDRFSETSGFFLVRCKNPL